MKLKTKVFLVTIFLSMFGSFVSANESDRTVKVMTYNMYLGTDLIGIFQAQSPEELVSEVWRGL